MIKIKNNKIIYDYEFYKNNIFIGGMITKDNEEKINNENIQLILQVLSRIFDIVEKVCKCLFYYGVMRERKMVEIGGFFLP